MQIRVIHNLISLNLDKLLKNGARFSILALLVVTILGANLPTVLAGSIEYRTIDGYGNNIGDPTFGQTDQQLLRKSTADYDDGVSSPAGPSRPSAREISNEIFAQESPVTESHGASNMFWLWGQFVDHDISLTQGASPDEPFDIPVPTGDPFFDPFNTGTQVIKLNRSIYDPSTGTDPSNPRQQINQITAFLDASSVYGSDLTRNGFIRDVGGKLKLSPDGLLPLNTAEPPLPNANGGPFPDEQLFVAGDVRANENLALTAMHTLFVREHNRLVDEIKDENPFLTDDQLYQEARKIVEAEIQNITYEEYLPFLLGPYSPSSYSGYNPSIHPQIANEFSTIAYRFGHTMLPSELMRINNDGTENPIPLKFAFFNPPEIPAGGGIDPLLKGAAETYAQDMDALMVDDVRNFLFGPPGSGGFDLASLNIQRGRDHGSPDFNTIREKYGLPKYSSFGQITSNSDIAEKLETLYGDVDNIDPWVGGLVEDHVSDAMIGQTFATIMGEQFERLRDGDRFWYENPDNPHPLSEEQLEMVKNSSLSDIIKRNTEITSLSDNVFVVGKSVGGEFIPVDMTFLLLSSAQTNLLWWLPLVIGGFVTGLFLVKRRN